MSLAQAPILPRANELFAKTCRGMPPKYKSQIGISARDLQKRVAVHRSRIAAAFEIYRRDRARRIVSSMRRLGGACIYARSARALKRALGLKFNPSGLGILNLSGFKLWRSDLPVRRAGPYPR